MRASTLRWRVVQLVLCAPILWGVMGGGCEIGLPGPGGGGGVIPIDFVTVELVNETGFVVDPGLYLFDPFEGFYVLAPDEGPILDALEVVTLDLDCLEGDLLGVDPIMSLGPGGDVISINAPELEEGFEYLCGDIITFFFTQDVTGAFFVEVAVNDVLLP